VIPVPKTVQVDLCKNQFRLLAIPSIEFPNYERGEDFDPADPFL
jgi:hypothetical protein